MPNEEMKTALQPVVVEDLWDDFASESGPEIRPEVLDELERRAAWRDSNPSKGKSLMEIAQSLGVRL